MHVDRIIQLWCIIGTRDGSTLISYCRTQVMLPQGAAALQWSCCELSVAQPTVSVDSVMF
jgi:LSD1 subclass zinc finger protein